ncbi:MAG: FtsX-like permease family protein, partial [Gemmatimonadales bacterium]
ARELMGADVVFRSNRAWPDSSRARLDSLAATVPTATVTSFASMAFAPNTGTVRLVNVQAVEGGYPFYGTIETDPIGRWAALQEGGGTIVDPAVLIQLDVAVGDTLWIGEAAFRILGVVTNRPGDVGLQTAIGARVYLADRDLPATRLLTFGSRAFYQRYALVDDNAAMQRFLNRHNALFDREQVRFETANDQEADIADALGALARFLGLIGLSALLLGGVGVASAVNVFVRQRLDTVATLRCLGARQSTVFTAYVLVAVALGLLGAAAGVVAGLAIQLTLPRVLGEFLPLAVTPMPSIPAALAGLGIGTGTALLFALLPLLALRNTPPLRALRRDVDPAGGRDLWRWVVVAMIGVAVIGLSISQAPDPVIGLAFAAAVAVTTGLLWVLALLLVRSARRFTPRRAPWVVRQGIANLFRPRNQTVAVTLALGFGVFLLATLWVVQRNLLDQFRTDTRPDRPNLVLFDIQTDQLADVRRVLADRDLAPHEVTPIVSARVAAINGRRVEALLSDSSSVFTGSRWALRREYRHTWRDTLTGSEEIVEGAWWREGGRAGSLPRISVEQSIMGDLGVALGDTLTWNVQGVEIPTVIASVRRVNWARFETNFFVVFEPGVLEQAPATWVILTRADSVRARAELQRDLVLSHPNVLALDLSLVQQSLDRVLSRVTLAIQFMALFSIVAGILILVGALAASRAQ